MTFLEKLADQINGFQNRFMRPVGVANIGDTNTEQENKLPVMPTWFVNSPYGQPRGVNIHELRNFAQSCWMQMTSGYIMGRFLITPYKFVNVDDEDEQDYAAERKKALEFFTSTNENGEDFIESLIPTIQDTVEIDAGVIVKRFTADSYTEQLITLVDEAGKPTGETQTMKVLKPLGQRQLTGLWYADGGTFLKQLTIHRQLMGYFQYSWKYPNANPIFFQREEISYWCKRPSSYRGYGFSGLQSVQQVVDILIQSARWNKEFFKNSAMPAAIVGIKGIAKEDIASIQKSWERDFKGKPHKIMLQNGEATYQSLQQSARDMEWLDGQEWYAKLIFAVHGFSGEELGFTDSTNGKNVQDGQSKTSAKNGMEPWFKLAEKRIYNDIMPEVLGMKNPPIKLVFDHQDTEKQTRDHAQHMDHLDRGSMTINEVRAKQGLDPVEWGDTPTQQQSEDKALDAKEQQSSDAAKKAYQHQDDPDVVEQASDYGDFFEKQVNHWEERTIKAISHVELDKTFGEFLQHMTNAINSSAFMTRVRKYIRDSMTEGLEVAEDEVGVQIGAGKAFNDRVKALEHQQLNGYTINGKHWHGIRGATVETRLEVLRVVEEGVKNKQSREEITRSVRDVFQGATMSQAKRITRTETTRFINEGKLSGYRESGIEGRKAWSVVPSKCCDECTEMSSQVVAFDETFKAPDGRALMHPPLHPNCRCVIEYREP